MSNGKMKGGANSTYMSLMLLPIIIAIIMTVVYGYFIYYVYELSKNINKECECSDEWIRYLLYFQSVIMALGLVMIYSIIGIGFFNPSLLVPKN